MIGPFSASIGMRVERRFFFACTALLDPATATVAYMRRRSSILKGALAVGFPRVEVAHSA